MKKTVVLFLFFALIFTNTISENKSVSNAVSNTFYKDITTNLLKEKTEFDIECQYSKEVEKLIKGINSNNDYTFYKTVYFLCTKYKVDDTNFDDNDYLYSNIKNIRCYYSDNVLHFYSVEYFEGKNQIKKVNVKLKKQSKKIVKKSKNTFEKILNAYKYVIKNVKYDYSGKNNSAYDGLFGKKKTMCNGYAMIMYKLLNYMNIPCKFISGKLKQGKKSYLHAWNIVKLKGKWYNLDACYDDEDDGYVYKDCFLVSDKKNKAHVKDKFIFTKSFLKQNKLAKKSYK